MVETYVPAAQFAQLVPAAALRYVPLPQLVHEIAADTAPYVPAAQSLQIADPVPLW